MTKSAVGHAYCKSSAGAIFFTDLESAGPRSGKASPAARLAGRETVHQALVHIRSITRPTGKMAPHPPPLMTDLPIRSDGRAEVTLEFVNRRGALRAGK